MCTGQHACALWGIAASCVLLPLWCREQSPTSRLCRSRAAHCAIACAPCSWQRALRAVGRGEARHARVCSPQGGHGGTWRCLVLNKQLLSVCACGRAMCWLKTQRQTTTSLHHHSPPRHLMPTGGAVAVPVGGAREDHPRRAAARRARAGWHAADARALPAAVQGHVW